MKAPRNVDEAIEILTDLFANWDQPEYRRQPPELPAKPEQKPA